MGRKLDTRAIGLDGGLHFIEWLTGSENLHYGYWDGLEVNAGNLARAQAAYTELLFSYLPDRPLKILDIGGGAGETAKKLLALGHEVQIVIPSALLAERCRKNAPGAIVHECKFEDFETTETFDLCLFSESFQYVPLDRGLSGARALLRPEGEILLADCFRSEEWGGGASLAPGGGHQIAAFEAELAAQPLTELARQDITEEVAPSIDLEQGLFNVIGHVTMGLDAELAVAKPMVRWSLRRALTMLMSKRARDRLAVRMLEKSRTAEAFCHHNRYLILRLKS